jgi:hypothetical protein
MKANDMQVGGDHYKRLRIQPWDAMESWMTGDEFDGFLRGNVIKYVARAGKKGDALSDLRKAKHYLDKLIERRSDNAVADNCVYLDDTV